TPAQHLCTDVRALLSQDDGHVYLACVNRGVLDDALILAAESQEDGVSEFIKTIVQSAALGSDGGACWPLERYPQFGVWPMDIESLVEEPDGGHGNSAISQILAVATNAEDWPQAGTCVAGKFCPFCTT